MERADLTLDLDALEKIQQEATPGPWRMVGDVDRACHGAHVVGDGWCVAECKSRDSDRCHTDARYIAAFSPETTGALLEMIREQAEKIRKLEGHG